jgi:hypothetical protein
MNSTPMATNVRGSVGVTPTSMLFIPRVSAIALTAPNAIPIALS